MKRLDGSFMMEASSSILKERSRSRSFCFQVLKSFLSSAELKVFLQIDMRRFQMFCCCFKQQPQNAASSVKQQDDDTPACDSVVCDSRL